MIIHLNPIKYSLYTRKAIIELFYYQRPFC